MTNPTNSAREREHSWIEWQRTHDSENYGRVDAFLAGHAAGVAECISWMRSKAVEFSGCPDTERRIIGQRWEIMADGLEREMMGVG